MNLHSWEQQKQDFSSLSYLAWRNQTDDGESPILASRHYQVKVLRVISSIIVLVESLSLYQVSEPGWYIRLENPYLGKGGGDSNMIISILGSDHILDLCIISSETFLLLLRFYFCLYHAGSQPRTLLSQCNLVAWCWRNFQSTVQSSPGGDSAQSTSDVASSFSSSLNSKDLHFYLSFPDWNK